MPGNTPANVANAVNPASDVYTKRHVWLFLEGHFSSVSQGQRCAENCTRRYGSRNAVILCQEPRYLTLSWHL